jgi:hypothetical protein
MMMDIAKAGFLAALVVVVVVGGRGRERGMDPCGLPEGITMDGLSPEDRADVVRRAMACRDVEHGRIAKEVYEEGGQRIVRIVEPVIELTPIWATSVRGFSTQYGEGDWSASRVLGAPDVAQQGTDDVNAWASLGADDRAEYLEVGFERAVRVSAVDIRESFNPGAVSGIELVGESGKRYDVGTRRELECSAEPIVAVRVTIDSVKVAGWNEIDAIGVQPCVE